LFTKWRREDTRLHYFPQIIPSNRAHHSYLRQAILDFLPKESAVLVFGIGFKHGSVDLRDSPAIDHALELLAAGHRVSIL